MGAGFDIEAEYGVGAETGELGWSKLSEVE